MLIIGIVIGVLLMLALTPGGSRSYHSLPFRWPDVPPPRGYCKRQPDPQGDKFSFSDD